MPGFDCNRFVGLSERDEKHLKCCICLNIFDNAVTTTSCGHSYCKQCIEEWIGMSTENNNCPVCRKDFQRKRSNQSTDDTNLAIIYNYVFVRSLLANAMVNGLKVKCDFQFNGCNEVIEFESLSTHVTQCEDRFCKICGLSAGKVGEHNCIELLKTDRNQLKEKLSEMNTLFNGLYQGLFSEDVDTKNIYFGLHNRSTYDVRLRSNGLYLNSYHQNRESFPIKFTSLEVLMYCSEPSLRLIIIRPDLDSCLQIKQLIDFPEECYFDVRSTDDEYFERTRYIIFELSEPFNPLIWTTLSLFAFKVKPQLKCQPIDYNRAKGMLETVIEYNAEEDTHNTNEDSESGQ